MIFGSYDDMSNLVVMVIWRFDIHREAIYVGRFKLKLILFKIISQKVSHIK